MTAQAIWLYCAGATRLAGAARVAARMVNWLMPPKTPIARIWPSADRLGSRKTGTVRMALTISAPVITTPTRLTRRSLWPIMRMMIMLMAPTTATPAAARWPR